MSIECYRSRGKNTYYSEGKRISKKIASTLSPKLPKCVSKTKSNEIKNLKKQLKEVMTHREQYKTTSSDLDSRLKACSIIREEYDRLVDMIKSATSSVDVMGRVCLTQDLKEKIDREYRELRETLESTTRSYDEKVEKLVSVVEKNQVDIESYQTEVVSLNNENKGLRDALNDNANVIGGLKEQLDRLQEERLNLIEEVNKLEAIIYNKNDEIVERMQVIGRLDSENRELKDNLTKMASDYDDLKDDFEDVKQRARSVVAELQQENEGLKEENEVLKQRLTNSENTKEEYINRYENDMGQADEEITRLGEALEQTSKKEQECEADKLVLQEDINLLRNSAENLRNSLIEEKNECLERVQRAIEETEGNISKREARKYEKELSDLNSKLRLTDEALDELKKAGSLEGKKMSPKSVKKAIKKLKNAGAKV
jgi:chromosome segregation ATPase